MNAEQFRNIINGAQEMPSVHCWNAIQQHLTAITAGGSVAGSASKAVAQSAGKTASMVGKGTLSVAKVAAISGATITIATVAVVAVVNLTTPKEPTAPISPASNPITALTIDTTTDITNLNTIETTATPTSRIYNPVISSESTNPQTIAYGDVVNNQNTPSSTLSTTAQSYNTMPTAGTVAKPATTTPIAPALVTTTPPAVTPTIKQTVTPPEKDPVASQYHQEDNHDYRPPVRIEIPNTITPNGDGYNDFFIITGLEQCDEYQLIIFNQARKEIFRTKNYQNNWDASHQDGSTFYYALIYKVNNIQEKRTGVIYVLR